MLGYDDSGMPGNAAQRETCAMVRKSVADGVTYGNYPADVKVDFEYDSKWDLVVFEIVTENSFESGTIATDGIVSWH